jgi:hypothetical protein
VTTPAQWWQITSLAWWQVNWFWAVALFGSGAAIIAWMIIRRENLKQKRLTDFSKSNTRPMLAILHGTQILFKAAIPMIRHSCQHCNFWKISPLPDIFFP